MTDTTNTNELTEQNEKPRATLPLAEADLRDYFAAKAMQGILSDHECNPTKHDLARLAYEMADVMLAMREETTS